MGIFSKRMFGQGTMPFLTVGKETVFHIVLLEGGLQEPLDFLVHLFPQTGDERSFNAFEGEGSVFFIEGGLVDFDLEEANPDSVDGIEIGIGEVLAQGVNLIIFAKPCFFEENRIQFVMRKKIRKVHGSTI